MGPDVNIDVKEVVCRRREGGLSGLKSLGVRRLNGYIRQSFLRPLDRVWF